MLANLAPLLASEIMLFNNNFVSVKSVAGDPELEKVLTCLLQQLNVFSISRPLMVDDHKQMMHM